MTVVGMILLLLLFVFDSIVLVSFLQGKQYKWVKQLVPASLAVSLCVLILDATKVWDFSGFHLLSLGVLLYGLLAVLFTKVGNKIPEKWKSLTSFAIKALCLCLFLEFFVFNINAGHLALHRYETRELDLFSCESSNFSKESFSTENGLAAVLNFKDVGARVGTITVDAVSNKRGFVRVNVNFSDDTFTDNLRKGVVMAEVLKYDKRTQTIPCNFSGETHALQFILSPASDETITVNRIAINEPIRFRFSLVRFFTLFFGAMLLYLMLLSPSFKRSYAGNRKFTKIAAYVLTAVLLVAALWMSNISRFTDPEHSLKKDFTAESGNQITEEIVKAFEQKRAYLDIEPSQGLLDLTNPYDDSQRTSHKVAYPWDHLLYEGKIYSYYGIGPVLLLFLPYHMITGYYFPSVWAVFLFGAVGIFFLTKLYLLVIGKFFSRVRSSIVWAGLVILQLSSGVWFCFRTPNFYEIAQVSGFVCVVLGFYFLLKSRVVGGGVIHPIALMFSSTFLSLAVLCRPTNAIYCIAALLFIWCGFRKLKTGNVPVKKGTYLSYFLYALVPFAVIGSVQMAYNYIRFGSVMDFGIEYSLTINDFTRSQFHLPFAGIGFFAYLFAFPKFSETFPFVAHSGVSQFQPQGYYFIAVDSAMGLLWRALPIFSYAYAGRAYKLSRQKDKLWYSIALLFTCVVCPLIIIFSIWESGYGPRYGVDFSWQMVLGALCIAFVIYSRCKDNTKRYLNTVMTVALLVSLLLNFGYVYSGLAVTEGGLSPAWTADVLSVARQFEFWR